MRMLYLGAAVRVAILLAITGCSHLPAPLPECRGAVTPINSSEVHREASHESGSRR